MTEEQKLYLIERCEENHYGKVLISAFVLKKYREFSGDYSSLNTVARDRIVDIYNGTI